MTQMIWQSLMPFLPPLQAWDLTNCRRCRNTGTTDFSPGGVPTVPSDIILGRPDTEDKLTVSTKSLSIFKARQFVRVNNRAHPKTGKSPVFYANSANFHWLHQLRPCSHPGCQLVKHLEAIVPVDTGIGDALAINQGGVWHDVLTALN